MPKRAPKRASYTVQLPLPPNELHPNARVHWRAKHRAKAAYRRHCGTSAFLQLQVRPELPAATIAATFRRRKGRNGQVQLQDPDNLIAWLKTAVDALQDAGLLANDRLVRYEHPEQVQDDERPGLQLVITEGVQ